VVLRYRQRDHGTQGHRWRGHRGRGLSQVQHGLRWGLIKVAGKLFRIGHLGHLNEVSCCAALAAAEMAMLDLGAKIKPGSGVGAAMEYYRKHVPVYREGLALERGTTDTRGEIRKPATAKMRETA
jgi:hypothetical protein